MEISLENEECDFDFVFKIDLIVWKCFHELEYDEFKALFKIDLIVWKYCSILLKCWII